MKNITFEQWLSVQSKSDLAFYARTYASLEQAYQEFLKSLEVKPLKRC